MTVRHSQSVSAPLLRPWIAAGTIGTITCMAGLGEACSHIAALLFAVEAKTRLSQQTSCTSIACQWKEPKLQNVEYSAISDIDFSKPKTECNRLAVSEDSQVSCHDGSGTGLDPPTVNELERFYSELSNTGKPAILSIIHGHSDKYIPKNVPATLRTLYNESNTLFSQSDLWKLCNTTFARLRVTDDEAKCIEKVIWAQSKYKIWFDQRAGRITASVFKRAANTDPKNPSKSLIKAICYPESNSFTIPATEWGVKNEEMAKEVYALKLNKTHTSFTVSESGLVINACYSDLGASPDSVIMCACCGSGVLKIKMFIFMQE